MSLDALKVSLKTVIITCVALLTWAGSLFGVYSAMQRDIDKLKDTVTELKDKNDKYNPEVLSVKMDNINEKVKEINEKANNIERILSQ